ncbi:NYN domain-containing protein [Candidatus Contubernalis alkaliaceticus]|uniref:NYN domain-containing protein n=1 Tax=Candidatus Contubernalis alkaliaceticus TaxID=338645 RepID=UPI001F4BF06E|nr:NYN domain-containing protein [Candidatus Contubernalis alkalaceticus]UNC93341.1 NYN domain-containing protein [Candidatus Contubernalis alkalaceticus]
MEYLIIDGYNIINSWQELRELAVEDMDFARYRLIYNLSQFNDMWDKLTVVFDAHLVPGGTESREMVDIIEVIYTREGERADNVIERITHNFKGSSNINIWVATSDQTEQQTIFSRGANRITPSELKSFLDLVKQDISINYTENIFLSTRNPLDKLLKKEVKEKLEQWRRGK